MVMFISFTDKRFKNSICCKKFHSIQFALDKKIESPLNRHAFHDKWWEHHYAPAHSGACQYSADHGLCPFCARLPTRCGDAQSAKGTAWNGVTTECPHFGLFGEALRVGGVVIH